MRPPSITAGIYSLVQGPQLVQVFVHYISYLCYAMPCLLYVARGAFTILYCCVGAGRYAEEDHLASTVLSEADHVTSRSVFGARRRLRCG